MRNHTRIEISKEYLGFSAAHFTVFSSTERERLHGHNFSVTASFKAPIQDDGLCFDYGLVKKSVKRLCESIDEYTLLADSSPYLDISDENDDFYRVIFNGKKLLFLKEDTLLLPIRNTTVEELSRYLLERLVDENINFVTSSMIKEIELKVYSGPGQCGQAVWEEGHS